jgi:hypothetical protein
VKPNSLLFVAHKDANIVNDQPAVSQEIIVVQTSKAFLYKLHKAKTIIRKADNTKYFAESSKF